MTTASCSPEQKPIPSKGQTPPLGYRRAAFLSFSQRRKRGAVDCTAAQAGSGGPPGERNGQYRHGERTKAAIAEQQKFSALLKMNTSKSRRARFVQPSFNMAAETLVMAILQARESFAWTSASPELA